MAKNIPFEKSFDYHLKSKSTIKWKHDKNETTPDKITFRTAKKYYFDCNNCNHEFYTSPDKIVGGSGCPYCCVPTQELCDDINCNYCREKSFASHNKSIYWNEIKNGNITARMVLKSSNKKYWFTCPCGHDFYSVVGGITRGSFCPYCGTSPKALCDKENCNLCYSNSFASHEKAKYWNYDKNNNNNNNNINTNINNIGPRNVFKNDNSKYYFNCIICSHTFNISLSNIMGNKWCSFCSNKQLCDDNNCNWCLANSFKSHTKAIMWSEKNGNISARQIAKCSGKKYWFKCNDCKHHFEARINHIVRDKYEKNCPYCSSQILCQDINCNFCKEKSFSSHKKSIYWSNINKLTTRQVFKSSSEKFWFNCECGHIIQKSLNSVSRGNWCPYCACPPSKLCDDNNCIQCLNKSFKSHYRCIFWSDKNKLNPRNVFKNSDNKYLFNCENGHEFNVSLTCISSQNVWCSKCTNKTEHKLYDKLKIIYENLQYQFRAEWCRNIGTNNLLPFDYVLEQYKIIIELDGQQHFVQVNNWCTPESTRKKDIYKMIKANENGYSIIRILQEDVYYDKYNWLNELKQNIEKVINESRVQNIFMCKKDEYIVYNLDTFNNNQCIEGIKNIENIENIKNII
jgi:very-short-patch-repair endonuclease